MLILGLNNPSIPVAAAMSGLIVLVWTIALAGSIRSLKKDPPRPVRLLLIIFVALLILTAPVWLYLIVTLFVLTDFK
jgi:predicted membrane channel-forming protein YqfA (hemolysin III family)